MPHFSAWQLRSAMADCATWARPQANSKTWAKYHECGYGQLAKKVILPWRLVFSHYRNQVNGCLGQCLLAMDRGSEVSAGCVGSCFTLGEISKQSRG